MFDLLSDLINLNYYEKKFNDNSGWPTETLRLYISQIGDHQHYLLGTHKLNYSVLSKDEIIKMLIQ